MRSERPKPLHLLCGRPMILHVLDAMAEVDVRRVVVVVGHRGEWVTKTLVQHAPPSMEIEFVEQLTRTEQGNKKADLGPRPQMQPGWRSISHLLSAAPLIPLFLVTSMTRQAARIYTPCFEENAAYEVMGHGSWVVRHFAFSGGEAPNQRP